MPSTKQSEPPRQTTVTTSHNAVGGESTYSIADSSTQHLRRVPDRIPWVVFLILVVELGERFTYFGLSGPLQNYINNPYDPGSSLPGALGRGQATASALGNFFKFWAYGSTIIGAIVADQFLGRFKTICLACFIYIIGLTILVTTAVPSSVHSGTAFGGLIAAMVIIKGLGTGGIKANVTPMCAEQYRREFAFVKLLNASYKGSRNPLDVYIPGCHYFCWRLFVLCLLSEFARGCAGFGSGY
ncbi:hypothetical protein ONS95_011071 [Cadophora gregata]|uniref:uncharacterized protein n=1 Tax=Cadophora gregata TaxID=51156 RepID=UPI0026DC268F|nr:uncharacterized protein ONS95_011071 [Cadophora gregata]KAK0119633.1 hypothetical protein ONS95_011071 [Cadophora gregata]KAK0120668.1 hypothetical protein ONS96_010870 [Cadophora gregata f. sp. sojae]